jgi:CheY-like chemotaxis protein
MTLFEQFDYNPSGTDIAGLSAFNVNEKFETCDEVAERRKKSGKKPLLILVADDEPLIRMTIVEILRREGYDAVAACDGEEAVECARKTKPDIFLADIAMPGMNGVDAAKKIRESLPETRVICFSGHASAPHLLNETREAGYDFEFLSKPVKPQLLIRVIRANPC